jgi:hypothetical protein
MNRQWLRTLAERRAWSSMKHVLVDLAFCFSQGSPKPKRLLILHWLNGAVNHGHATFAHAALEFAAISESSGEPGGDFCHEG